MFTRRTFGSALRAATMFATAAAVTGAMPASLGQAQQIGEALEKRLTLEQQRAYVLHLRARAAFEREAQAYWARIEELREARRRKRAQGQPFTRDDYVPEHPPKYAGPALANRLKAVSAIGSDQYDWSINDTSNGKAAR